MLILSHQDLITQLNAKNLIKNLPLGRGIYMASELA